MVVSGHGISLFVRLAILFLLACILVLFAAAAVLNHSSFTDDDDASTHTPGLRLTLSS